MAEPIKDVSKTGRQRKEAEFHLVYGDLLIGILSFREQWEFRYSEEFRQSRNLRPIIGFSEVDRVYRSKTLWVFFQMRIPPVDRSDVKDVLVTEGIADDDTLTLLARFGKRTIANPFCLELVSC